MAGLHRYFTPQTRSECLPDPRGPLSREIPSSAITAANSEVKAILGNEFKKERGHYHKLSPGHCVTNSRK